MLLMPALRLQSASSGIVVYLSRWVSGTLATAGRHSCPQTGASTPSLASTTTSLTTALRKKQDSEILYLLAGSSGTTAPTWWAKWSAARPTSGTVSSLPPCTPGRQCKSSTNPTPLILSSATWIQAPHMNIQRPPYQHLSRYP